MIKLKRDGQKGVTLVTLSIAIIIMIIITSTLIYNITTGSKVKALNNMYYDITKIKDKLDMYYINYHTIPILETPYKNTSHIQGVNPNDNGVYYVIDLEALESMNLNYGQDYNTYKTNPSDTLTNLYIVNERSHSIYYVQGVLFDNKTYYTKPEESTKVELTDILSIELIDQQQETANIKMYAVDKTNGIKKITLNVNGEDYKTYTYDLNYREIKTEIEQIKLEQAESICYFQIEDEEGNVKKSNEITIKRKMETIADKSGANVPNVDKIAQKTYVTWKLNEAGTQYVINDTQETPPSDWYDYDKGNWANIKTTNNGLEAYWVWIPRYEYIVPTSTTATEIEVKFIPVDQKEADTGYTIHPAFTNEGNGGFGELDGIWVAKFEASSNTTTPDTNYGGGDSTTLKVQVKPGVQSWRYITANNVFTVCRKMTSDGEVLEGSKVDSHMMKNTEWGAVVILSQSKYGIFNSKSSIEDPTDGTTRRIWNNSNGYNNYKNFYTGYVGDAPDASIGSSSTTAPTNVYEYNTINGPKASTTGTVYGVYDMAGGSWEYVAGVLKGRSTDLEYARSKFDISNQTRPNGVTEADFAKKYLDLYDYRTSKTDYTKYIIGDATREVKGWNGDSAFFVHSSYPVFLRGRLFQR